MPESGVEDARIVGNQFEIGRARRVGDGEHLLPIDAAIGGAVDAALFVCEEWIAQGGDINDVRILGVNADGGDLAHVAQSDKLPGFARVGRLVHAAPDGHIAANFGRAGAGIHDVRVGLRDLNGAHGSDGDLAIRHIDPGVTGIGSLPDAAAGRTHIEGEGLRGDAGDGGNAAAALGADHAVFQVGPEGGVGGVEGSGG